MARRNSAGEWIGFLKDDNDLTPPAKGWANHATVMGYYLHRIKDERTIYRGQEIRGGTHSFLRGKTWHRVDSGRDDELTCRITRGGREVFAGSASTAQLKRRFPEIVEWLVRSNEIRTGTVLSTGTGIIQPMEVGLAE